MPSTKDATYYKPAILLPVSLPWGGAVGVGWVGKPRLCWAGVVRTRPKAVPLYPKPPVAPCGQGDVKRKQNSHG